MLRITASMGSSAKSYYTKADYYSERGEAQESPGTWGGKLAERLGLQGVVDKERFDQLVDNISPHTGKSLTARTKGEGQRRSGYDFTFDLPKKTSIYYSMSKDERVMEAFDSAVEETVAELERDTRTRIRKGGAFSERVTGELLSASFLHSTARPVNGIPEPHIHKHVFVFNATFDPVENRLKAIDVGAIKRDATYYQEAFHSRVASKLRAAGIHTERTPENYDLAGLDRGLTDRFSSRTKLIEETAKTLGIDSAEAKGQLGAKTRASKATDFTLSELREVWDERITDPERRAFGTIARGQAQAKTPDVSAAQAVDHAIEHCFARESVTSLARFTAEALRASLGSATVEEIKAEIAGRPEILTTTINDRVLCSTRTVIREEAEMTRYASEGRGACEPLVSPSRQVIADERLSEEQRAAVKFAWSSTDSVILIRGAAGTGKTTLMQEMVRGIEAEGKTVFSCAPTAQASRGVQRDEGFNADTLARLLQDEGLQQSLKGAVIWLDEGGLAGCKSLHSLFALAGHLEARVIITSDTSQHAPVDRGDAVSILEKNSGCKSASVTQIRRQKHAAYRDAVTDLSEARTDAAFAKLDQLGYIKEAGADRHKLLAADYLKAIDDKRTVLVVAPTHREIEAVTREVRAGLRDRGLLKGKDRQFTSLRNDRSTTAELRDPVTYREGQVLQFVQNVPALKRGEKVTVASQEGGTVFIRRASGETLPLSVGKYADRFQRYEVRPEFSVAVGDKIRVTQNGFTKDGKHRVDNGSTYTVGSFTPEGDLKLKENSWVIPKEFGHLTHGVASTSHSSQGKSIDRVLVSMSTESLVAANREQFYVSCSRGKESVTIYTNSREELREAVRESGRRLSATEVFGRADPAHSHALTNARLRAYAESATLPVEAARERHEPAQDAGKELQQAGAEHER